MEFDPENHLLTVADTWGGLRKCDLYRLLDETPGRYLPKMASAICTNRPDLKEETAKVEKELAED